MSDSISHDEKDKITELLVGHKIAKVADDTLQLDDGRKLRFVGNDGGCACVAGCYDLTELNGTDNIITNVEFVDSPAGDAHYDYDRAEDRYSDVGHYKIFVFADNQKINLATFVGTDGNGYYGTGYEIHVLPEAAT